MKKLLSLLIVMTLLLSVYSFETVNAATFEDTESSAVDFLVKIGVIDASNDALFENTVTREDFALYIANLLGIDTSAEPVRRYFTDVSMTSYGSKAIEALVELGIISTTAENKFRPEDNVTYNEAVKMLCCALGYGEYAELTGGFPSGYIKVAKKNDFLISVSDEKAMTVREVAKLIFGAAQTNVFEPIVFEKDGIEYGVSSEATLLSLYHNIYFDEGTVDGVYGRTINFNNPPEKNHMSVNNETYYADETVNKDEYLGDYVKYFYRKTSDGKYPQIVYIAELKNEKVRFSISNFEAFDYEQITYYEDNTSSKLQKKNLDNPVIIYNGYPVKTNISELFKGLNKGYITIKDSDYDKKYDLVLIDDYETVVVSGVDIAKQMIFNQLGNGTYLDLSEYTSVKLYDNDMNVISLEDIKENVVLSVAGTHDNKETFTAIVSEIQLNGTLASIKEKNQLTAVINGKEYVVDKKYADTFKNETKSGHNYYYSCDFMGEIVYVSASSKDSMSYAYVIDAGYKEEAFEETVLLKVVDSTGKITVIPFAQKIKIDGIHYKNDAKRAYSAFLTLGSGALKPSMIRYTLDAEGKFKEIDTPFLNEPYENDRSSLTPIAGFNNNFSSNYYRINRLGLTAYVTSETPVYCVPYSPVYGEIEQSEVVVKPVKSNVAFRQDVYYPSVAYTTNVANEFADVIAVQYQYNVNTYNSWDRRMVLVDEVMTGLSQDGEVVKILCGYTRGQRVEYEIDNRVELGDIGQGDLIQLNYSINGKIMPSYTAGQPDVVILYDYSLWQGNRPDSSTGVWKGIVQGGRCYLVNGAADSQYYNAAGQLSFGFANEVVGNTVRFGYNSGADFDEAFRVSGVSVLVYDKSQREGAKVYVGSVNDIAGYKFVGEDCSSILLQTHHSQPKQIVVYK